MKTTGNFVRTSAATLLELLIVLAIIATLFALLVPAIAAIRTIAIRVRCANQVKQIMLAAHNYASVREGRLPSVYPDSWHPRETLFFLEIRKYIDQGQLVRTGTDTDPLGAEIPVYQCKLIRCPGDPTISGDDFSPTVDEKTWSIGNCSYAASFEAMSGSPKLDRSFSDGSSTTIALLEHYARCAGSASFLDIMEGLCLNPLSREPIPFRRRATFTDGPNRDVTSLTGPTLRKSFQVAPANQDCDYRIPQTPHSTGIVCAMVDGSVRTISGSISPATFWAAVTPNGRDPLGDDW